MALEIKGLQRIFKFRQDSKYLVFRDQNYEMTDNDVIDF